MLEAFEGWGFNVARPRLGPTDSAEELVEFHRGMAQERSSLGYAVDGVVYKLNDLGLQVGRSEGEPDDRTAGRSTAYKTR